MIAERFALAVLFAATLAAILAAWHMTLGFDAADLRWWRWLLARATHPAGVPAAIMAPAIGIGIAGLLAMLLLGAFFARARSRTLTGGRDAAELHGSARWAERADVKAAGLFSDRGVVVGGWPKRFGGVRTLRHDGPEHVMVFAPTRSGKGVSLIVPTLLTWPASVVVLDIKGENYALSAGWRAAQGHRVLRFEPTADTGTVRFNPLAEVRLTGGRDIADCQNIAAMIIDPDGQGLRDYWRQEGWTWLSVVLLHVIYRVRREEDRSGNLDDVNTFVSGITSADGQEDDFEGLLDDMIAYEHGAPHVDAEVRRGASRMRIKAPQERSGVHSSAITQLALYADPVIARNTSVSDFALADLMGGEQPTALYLIIPPSDIDRLRPLIRIIMNLFLRRLTERLDVTAAKHRLLLMLDEFTSVGRLEIFERALAFMSGYGLKAFVVVQDLAQLQQAYGRDESIMSNCHVRIAFAPNRIETAKALSDLTGRTTVVQATRSHSGRLGQPGSVSDSLRETGRPLLTADECMRLRGIERRGRRTIPGEALIFAAGAPPIRSRQKLYFQDRELRRRASLPPPVMSHQQQQEDTDG